MRGSFLNHEFNHLSVFKHFIMRISLEDCFRVRRNVGVDFFALIFGNPIAVY
jgi:hypothetical protein